MIEKDSGNITELVDLIDLLPDYYSTTSLPDKCRRSWLDAY